MEGILNLAEYDGKYVRIRDTYGNDYSGRARNGNADILDIGQTAYKIQADKLGR